MPFLPPNQQYQSTEGFSALASTNKTKIKNQEKEPQKYTITEHKLECGPMPNVMVALPIIGGALCSTPQSLAHAYYLTAVQ